MRAAATFLLIGAILAGCQAERPRELRNTGYSDRCADIMRQSFPGAEIDIKETGARAATAEHGDLGLMIIDVEGVRPDVPETGGFLARSVAARCRFENGVLTEFRWTKGPYR
jgi:hypothetical protein